MSTKKKNEWKGYLNYTLSNADKKTIKETYIGEQACFHWLNELVESGYSHSAVWDAKSKSVRLTVTGRTTKTDVDGYSISSWGKELAQCVAILHYVFCSGRFGENLEGIIPTDGEDWW